MKGRNVIRVVVPELHHFVADECDVEIAGAAAIRIVWSAIFITLIRNYTAAESNAGTLRQSSFKPREKLPKSQRIPIEGQFGNPIFDLFVSHIVNAFGTHVRFSSESSQKDFGRML